MATTTTNYGFDVPTSSDLVKNGATAISTLGQDIDTFLFRPFSKNVIVNGGQTFWQRGTSFALSGGVAAYCADRWQGYSTNLGRTVSRQGAATTGYIARVQRDSGNSLTGLIYYGSSLESQSTVSLIGQTVTLSFSARAGANFSSASGVLSAFIVYGTGTDQNLFSGLTGQTTVATSNVTLTTTMQRFTLTGTVNAAATQIAVYFVYTPTGTAGAADYFDVQNIQLEAGSQATPFTRACGTIQGELAACQRYYKKYGNDTGLTAVYASGFMRTTTELVCIGIFNVPMRTVPTLTTSGTFATTLGNTVSAISNAAVTTNQIFRINVTVSTGTIGDANALVGTSSGTEYIEWSAEL